MRQILLILVLCGILLTTAFPQQSPWLWVNPLPQGNPLNGIWATNKDSAIAVGGYGTVVRTTNGGSTWQVEPASGGIFDQLFATEFISSDLGWAVGEGGQILKTTDGGARWSLHEAPTYQDLYGLDFRSGLIGWVAGRGGTIFATTDGGVTWLPQPSGTTAALYAIFFVDDSTGWVAGASGKILKTTNGGTSWTPQASGISSSLYSIHFNSQLIGWATGSGGIILKTVNGGANWIPQFSGTGLNLYTVQFVNSLTGWAGGAYGTILKTTNSGISWFQQTTSNYNDIFGMRMVSSTEGWAVGDFGTTLATTDGGASWSNQSTGPKTELTSISFPVPGTGWAVGDEGLILRTTNSGLSWIKQNSGLYLLLNDVDFITGSIGWAVGDSAVIVKTTNSGITWNDENSRTDISLYSVDFVSTAIGWAAGDDGTILKTLTGGGGWTPQITPTSNTLQKIKFLNTTLGWAVGYGGVILKTTDGGTTWNEQVSNTGQTLYSVSFANQNVGYASGDFGTIVSTTDGGNTWTEHSTGTDATLYDLTFINTSTGWAVGEEGTIVKTTDGGNTWELQTSGTINDLLKVQLVRSGAGGVLYAAGIGGTIICSSVSPLPVRTWTGAFDSLWFTAGNWSPIGAPEKLDSVVIPVTPNKPVIRQISQQVNISALKIFSGTKLSIGSELGQLSVKGTIDVGGNLEIDSNATTEILMGGSFLVAGGGRFIPGKSTLAFTSRGQVKGSFYNVIVYEGAIVQTIGNVEIKNTLLNLSNFSLRPIDTLTIRNSDPAALQGPGVTGAGTIKRAILPGSTEDYRFESPVTFLRFAPVGTIPDTILMTTYPNTLYSGLKDSLFVKRYYSITAKGGSNYRAFMSLRYDTSESKIPIDELALFRDSSGVLMNMGETDFLDSDLTAILLDSVKGFSNWLFGQIEYYPKHPYEFLDSLFVNDNGLGKDTLFFGSSPGASDGLDTTYGEAQLNSKPPAGTFDTRWSIPPTKGSITDIRDVFRGNRTQNVYTCSIQTSVTGPVLLRWNRSLLPIGSFFLRDSATQGGQFNVNMRLQSTYTITNTSIKVVQIVSTVPRYFSFNNRWNMISLPITSTSDRKKTSIFPNASSFAYKYSGGYLVEDTLRNGRGYWLKLPAAQTLGMEGFVRQTDTMNIVPGWNMIGSVTYPVAIANIVQIPPNNTSGNYYNYFGGYYLSDSIRPAKGYWIKAGTTGKLILSSTGPAAKQTANRQYLDEIGGFNSLSIGDNDGNQQTLYFGTPPEAAFDDESFELPPNPPAGMFDARFSSQRIVEVMDHKGHLSTITIQSASYPVTIHWHLSQQGIQSVIFTDALTGKSLGHSTGQDGSMRVTNPAVTGINLEVKTTNLAPKEFLLRQNYPNPFNPNTKIEFELPIQSTVTLKVYNLLGQQVAALAENNQYESGNHALTWDGSNVASGVYLYQIVARSSDNRNFQQVKKMLLIK